MLNIFSSKSVAKNTYEKVYEKVVNNTLHQKKNRDDKLTLVSDEVCKFVVNALIKFSETSSEFSNSFEIKESCDEQATSFGVKLVDSEYEKITDNVVSFIEKLGFTTTKTGKTLVEISWKLPTLTPIVQEPIPGELVLHEQKPSA